MTSSRPSARRTRRLEGHFSFVVIHRDEPERLVGVRRQTPLVVGLGDGESFVRLERRRVPAPSATRVQYPGRRRDHRAHARRACGSSAPPTASPVELEVHEIDWDEEVAERDGYETFMLKEIYEQPERLRRDDRRRASGTGRLVQDGLGWTEDDLRKLRRIVDRRLRHGVPRRRGRPVRDRGVGARPVEPDIASEWIYRAR